MKLYPTKEHEEAAEKFVEIFSKDKRVSAILLTGSCARGKATKDSCLDLTLIVRSIKNKKALKKKFEVSAKKFKEFKNLKKIGKFSNIDLEIIDGKIKPKERGWTSGPDSFEVEIGNIFVYGVVLFERGNYFKKLKKKYIPYYNEKLRGKRLKEVKKFLLNNLEHIPLYIKRGIYFQAFDRMYKANQEFIQALFIKNKVYPIAYDKWIKEQFYELLKMPNLYKELVENIQTKNLVSSEVAEKAEKLKSLAKKYL